MVSWVWMEGDRMEYHSFSTLCALGAHRVIQGVIPGDRLGIAQTPLVSGVCGYPGQHVDESVD